MLAGSLRDCLATGRALSGFMMLYRDLKIAITRLPCSSRAVAVLGYHNPTLSVWNLDKFEI